MVDKRNFYYLFIVIALNAFLFSMEEPDNSGEHPEVLMEDLANLTDTDLEFKDSDQLELLLLKIERAMQNPFNDFDGQFNVPEKTDNDEGHILANYAGPHSKIAHLEMLKQRIGHLLRERDAALGPRD